MTSGLHLSKKMMKAWNANPALGPILHIEPFRPRGVIVGFAICFVSLPILLALFGNPKQGFGETLVVQVIFLLPGFVIWHAFQRRLVVCAHGLLFGPTQWQDPCAVIPYDQIDYQSLTPLRRFHLLSRKDVGWRGNGSSIAWGKWGIVFRARAFSYYPNYDHIPFTSLSDFIFGSQREPSTLIQLICTAAAEHGCHEALKAPALNEPPVVLTISRHDLAIQLPRVYPKPNGNEPPPNY